MSLKEFQSRVLKLEKENNAMFAKIASLRAQNIILRARVEQARMQSDVFERAALQLDEALRAREVDDGA